jgi:PAS domain S-box-containing protein
MVFNTRNLNIPLLRWWVNYRNNVLSYYKLNTQVEVKEIKYWREKIFTTFTIYLLPVSLIALLPSLIVSLIDKFYGIAFFDIAAELAIAAIIFSRSINIRYKKIFIVGVLYGLALFLIAGLGSFVPGIIYLLALTVITSLIFSYRVVLWSVAANTLICVMFGLVIHFKLFNSPLIAQYSLLAWTAYSSNLVFLSYILAILINRLINGLDATIVKLALSEARQRSIFESQTNYVIRTDLQGHFSYVNEKFKEDFAWVYGDTSILGEDSMLSIADYHHQKVRETVARCMAYKNEVFHLEVDRPGSNNQMITTYWDCVCLTDDKNEPTEIQCIGVDITERIKTEQDLKRLANDLYKRNRELQTFSYVVSHNLRLPVANITGLVGLLEISKDDPETFEEGFQKLKYSTGSLDQVITDLSKIISLGDSTVELTRECIDIIQVISSVEADLATIIQHSGATIIFPDKPYRTLSHKAYMYSIFYNLIYNAIKYKSEVAPHISINVITNAQSVIITVTDNGIGIDLDKHLDDLFKPYKKFNPAIAGKGLGLFLVKNHVEALNGIILVESELGMGTTFTIILPTK